MHISQVNRNMGCSIPFVPRARDGYRVRSSGIGRTGTSTEIWDSDRQTKDTRSIER